MCILFQTAFVHGGARIHLRALCGCMRATAWRTLLSNNFFRILLFLASGNENVQANMETNG